KMESRVRATPAEMNAPRFVFRRWLCAALMLCGLSAGVCSRGADSLVWQQDKNRVTAEIGSWDLPQLLETISSATGWQIYADPDAKHRVSIKFRDRSPGEALRLLLGELNFALLPQTNAPSRLFVFRNSLQEATQFVRAPAK